jgi:hypothetical protein
MMSKVATLMAFLGALAAAGGAALFYRQQAQLSGSSVWPLPGLVLLLWAGLGMLGFLGALFQHPIDFIFLAHRITPLYRSAAAAGDLRRVFDRRFRIHLDALFVGRNVLIITQKKLRWLDGLNFGMLGVIISLGLMLIFIALGSNRIRRK